MEDRRNVGESSCNFGDGTDQRVQSLMFMMMMMMRGIACTEDCAVSSPDNDFPILTTADTEGHVPGG